MNPIDFNRLPIGDNLPFEINCLVEIPKGCTNKYEFDKEHQVFRLDRVLYEAVFFPAEYGLIPQTLNNEDKDPLDIMVLSSFPTFPGCLISSRPIGVIRLEDTKENDAKIVAVPADDPRFDEVRELGHLSAHQKKELVNFWENYSELQPNKKIKIKGWSHRERAYAMIKDAHQNFLKVHSSG